AAAILPCRCHQRGPVIRFEHAAGEVAMDAAVLFLPGPSDGTALCFSCLLRDELSATVGTRRAWRDRSPRARRSHSWQCSAGRNGKPRKLNAPGASSHARRRMNATLLLRHFWLVFILVGSLNALI